MTSQVTLVLIVDVMELSVQEVQVRAVSVVIASVNTFQFTIVTFSVDFRIGFTFYISTYSLLNIYNVSLRSKNNHL